MCSFNEIVELMSLFVSEDELRCSLDLYLHKLHFLITFVSQSYFASGN